MIKKTLLIIYMKYITNYMVFHMKKITLKIVCDIKHSKKTSGVQSKSEIKAACTVIRIRAFVSHVFICPVELI
jgi:hypothetical protein